MREVSALHERLVDELKRRKYILTPGVEAAFRTVPRHLFVPGVPLGDAYRDMAIPTKRTADGRFISSSSRPATMAIMLEQLGLAPGHRVLEIGAGTGYNAALMAHLVGRQGRVVTVDIDEHLVDTAREHLAAAGFERVLVVCGDGGLGYPDAAPYDRIILTVGAWDITPAWTEQLRPGGRLLLPLSIKGPQLCVGLERVDEHLESVSIEEGGFIGLRGAFAGPEGSVRIGEINMGLADPTLVDLVAVNDWLKAPGRDQPTGIRVRAEAFGPLSLWLALREPGFCFLACFGDAVDRSLIPDLFRLSSTIKRAHTIGVLGEHGLCMLMRSPEAMADAEAEAAGAASFELFLRTCGPDNALADRVIGRIKEWDATGRPSRKGLRIRVYPKKTWFAPSSGELVVDKRWSRLIIDWPGGG